MRVHTRVCRDAVSRVPCSGEAVKEQEEGWKIHAARLVRLVWEARPLGGACPNPLQPTDLRPGGGTPSRGDWVLTFNPQIFPAMQLPSRYSYGTALAGNCTHRQLGVGDGGTLARFVCVRSRIGIGVLSPSLPLPPPWR